MSCTHAYLQVRSADRLNGAHKLQGYHQAPLEDPQELLLEARAYLHLFHQECGMAEVYSERLIEIQDEIERTGTYQQTYDELSYGAKVAWRNNTRCIGRLHWKSLAVRDMRHLETEEEIFAALVEHLLFGTNGGRSARRSPSLLRQYRGSPAYASGTRSSFAMRAIAGQMDLSSVIRYMRTSPTRSGAWAGRGEMAHLLTSCLSSSNCPTSAPGCSNCHATWRLRCH
jgi:hypothetical protein